MGGRKRRAHSRRKGRTRPKHPRQPTIRGDKKISKERPRHGWLKATLAVVFAGLFIFCVGFLWLNWPFVAQGENPGVSTPPSQPSVPRAAILDGLWRTRPNSTFTRKLLDYLGDAGFQVDLYQGENVTINLLRNIGGYKLLVLRLHTAIYMGWLYLFSGEPYTKYRYVAEQLSGSVEQGYIIYEDASYFALNATFLGINNAGGMKGSVIILMGCNGTDDSYSIQRFFERGTEAYIAWNGYVDLPYSDGVTLRLIKALYSDGLSLNEAVERVTKEFGPDPHYGSILYIYQGD